MSSSFLLLQIVISFGLIGSTLSIIYENVGSVEIKVCCPVNGSERSDTEGQQSAGSFRVTAVRRCHLVAAGGVVLKRNEHFQLLPHTCGTQRMAFRDEPTAGVDHKFTSICVVPSVDHLSGFTCRGLEM